MSSTTFDYRYETGWQGRDGTLENMGEYFSKKWQAMEFAQLLFKREPDHFRATYVYDRCLGFTRWFDGSKWTRKQPVGAQEAQ